ncbi:hypothetical protein Sste5346_010158 [Sporothrix stenoceras]|uniref:Cupin type-2 domain-containing protein n=1 Tax=Sporothrix stenoceras TaxID=5173 RepID=A0ABR3YIE2_9PEZI
MSPSTPKELTVLRPSVDYGLRTAQRHITTVDAASGQSVFAPKKDLLYCDRGGYSVSWNYATSAFPADLADSKDLTGFLSDDVGANPNSVLYTGSRIVNSGGITFNTTNFAPGTETVMHRTLSLDFVTVVQGTMELELDSGEKVVLQAGDSIVQRQTNHLWRNPSPDQPARMVSVITPAHGVTINGQSLVEEGFSINGMGKPGSK